MSRLPIHFDDLPPFVNTLQSEIEKPIALNCKEISILKSRILENKTLDQVAEMFGKTRQRIAQWQNIAIRKLIRRIGNEFR